jgi:hypothetical protein
MAGCALAALLSEGGPVRVAVRPCCVAALVGAAPPRDPAAPEDLGFCEAEEAGLVVAPARSGAES